MDLENVRKEILGVKLDISEYFRVAFSVFKILLKENKLLAFLQYILILAPIISIFLGYFWMTMLALSGYTQLIPMFFLLGFILVIAFVIANNYFIAYFSRKIALKVEGRADKFSTKGILIKSLAMFGISAGLRIILSVLERFPFIGTFLAFLANIAMIVIFIWALLYFYDIYYIRNFTLSESLDYSLKLSEGNRLKKIIPGIIFVVVAVIGSMIIILPFSSIVRGFSNGIGIFLVVIVISVVICLFFLYSQALQIVIYLNVENNYLKNEGKDSKYNFKDKEEIDLRNSQIPNNFSNENNEK